MVYKVTSAHEEGGEREYAINTVRFVGDEDGNLTGLDTVRVEQVVTEGHMRFQPVEGSEQHSRPRWCFLQWASPARNRTPSSSSSASISPTAAMSPATTLGHQRRRRVRRR